MRFPDAGESGIAEMPFRPAIYLTGESHHSLVKIARTTGVGTSALHEAPTGGSYTLDAGALAERIEADRKAGRLPLMVVGTAGTTGAGIPAGTARLTYRNG